MKARCYASLRKSEDPHYLAKVSKEDNDKTAVSRAHCYCKGGSGGHCGHFLILVQPQMEKCLIHHQAANLDCWR